jgi:uncharacterized protein YndB with AHSA1/START domain
MDGLPPEIAAWLKETDRQARRDGSRTAAVIRRAFAAPRGVVWRAFTDRERLRSWFGEVSGDLKAGAEVKLEIGVPHKVGSLIRTCDPAKALDISWRYEGHSPDYIDEIGLRLEDSGDGTDVRLEHRSSHGTDPAGVGPGWENWLFRLTGLLEGRENPRFSDELEIESARLWTALSG